MEGPPNSSSAQALPEAYYRLFADYSFDWETWVGPAGQYLYCSPSAERVTGYAPEAFLTDPDFLLSIIHPDDQPAFIEHRQKFLGPQPPVESDFRIVRRDGEVRWLNHWCQPVFSPEGECLGRRASNRDITDRKIAEEQREDERERAERTAAELQAITSAVGDGLAIYGPDGQILRVNESTMRILGFSAEQMLLPWEERLTLADLRLPSGEPLPREMAPGRRVFDGETVTDMMIRARRADGAEIWLSLTGAPIRNADGEITAAAVTFRDVTELRQAQQHAEQRATELETIVGSMLDGVTVYDLEGRALIVNDAASRILKFDEEQIRLPWEERLRLIEPRLASGEPLAPEMAPRARATRGETVEGLPLLVRRGDGVDIWVSLSAAPLRSADGTVVGAVVTFRDETELRHAQQQAEQRAEELDTVIAAIPDGITMYNVLGKQTRMNDAARGMTGYTAEHEALTPAERAELAQVRKPSGELLTPEEIPGNRALAGEVVDGFELLMNRVDGVPRHIMVSAVPLREATGRVFGAVISLQDITPLREQQRAVEHLAAEAQRKAAELDTVIASIPDGVIVFGADSGALRMNDAAIRVLGYTDVELALPLAERLRLRKFRTADGQPLSAEHSASYRARQGETVTGFTAFFEHPDGREVWLTISAAPLLDGGGEIVGTVSVFTDITEKIGLQQQAEHLATEASRRADELDTIINSIADGVMIYDMDGNAVRANAAFRAMTNYTDAEMALPLEARRDLLDLRDGEGRPLLVAEGPAWRAIHGETLTSVPLMLFHGTAREVICSCSAAPLHSPEGAIVGAVVTFTNVTELKRTQEQAQRQAVELEGVLAAMRDAVVVYDRNGTIVRANRELLDEAGDDLLGKSYAENFAERGLRWPDGTPLRLEEMAAHRALHGEHVYNEEMMRTGPGGLDRWNLTSAAPLYREGELVGAVAHWRDVTELRRTQERLAQHAVQMDAVVNNIHEGLVIINPSGELLLMNPAAALMHGFADVDDYLRHLSQYEKTLELRTTDGGVIPPDEWPLARALRGEAGSDYEAWLPRMDTGQPWLASFNYAPVLDADGRVVLALNTVRDITEHRRAEADREQLGERLSALLETMPAGVIICDAEGQFTLVNAYMREMMGINVTGDAGGPTEGYTLHHPDGSPFAPEELPLRRALDQGQAVNDVELVFHTTDGTQVQALASARPLHDVDGKLRGAVAVIRDVTPLKRAQEQAQRQATELSTIVRTLPDGVVVLDHSGMVVSANDTAESLFGWSAEEQKLPWVQRMIGREPRTTDGARLAAEELPAARSLRGEVVSDVVFCVRCATDRETWLLVNAAPLYADGGALVGTVATFTDITALHQAQERLQHVNEELAATGEELQISNEELQAINEELQATNEELQVAQRALDRERNLLTAIIEHLPGAFVAAVPPGLQIIQSNRYHREFAGGYARPGSDPVADPRPVLFYPDGREVAPCDWPMVQALRDGTTTHGQEYLHRCGDELVPIRLYSAPVRDSMDNTIATVMSFYDISEEKRAEQERERLTEELQASNEGLAKINESLHRAQEALAALFTDQERETALLRLMSDTGDAQEMLKRAAVFLRDWFGCEAIGIRWRHGDDYPYLETTGFAEDFVRKENELCAHDDTGRVLRDGSGYPIMECMCGNILRGRTDPSLPFFSSGGSFWTNSTTSLLSTSTEQERQARTRNRCNGEGYESVALIPLRFGETIMGLLQLNDRQRGRFTLEGIERLERLAGSLAVRLAQEEAEQELRRHRDHLEDLIRERTTELVASEARLRKRSEDLQALPGITEELIKCNDLDTFYRRAVELARERLGLERCGLFVVEGLTAHGTYGTDLEGRTRDEHGRSFELGSDFVTQMPGPGESTWSIVDPQRRATRVQGGPATDPPLDGWNVASLVQAHGAAIAVFFNDAAITNAPLDVAKQEIVAVYGTLLGGLLERKQAEQRLQASEQQYRELVQTAQSAIVRWNREGTIEFVNEYAEELLGYEPGELLGQPFTIAAPPVLESGQTAEELVAAIVADPETFKLVATDQITKDGRRLWVAWSHEIIRDEAGDLRALLAVGIDRTEQHRAELELRRLNRVYSVLSGASDAIIRLRDRGELFREICRIAVEDGLFRMAWIGRLDPATGRVAPDAHWGNDEGYLSAITVSAQPVPQGLGPTGRAAREGVYQTCDDIATDPRMAPWADAAAQRGYRSSGAFPFVAGDTTGVLTLYSGEPDFFDDQRVRLLQALAVDLAIALEREDANQELQARQEKLRALATELALAEQRERQRIATGLHDDICQTLAFAKMKLGQTRWAQSPEEAQAGYGELGQILDGAIRETRELIYDLSTPILYQRGLAEAIVWRATRIHEEHGLQVEVTVTGEVCRLPEEAEVTVFQALKELLTNAVKYAPQAQVRVSVRYDAQELLIVVEDDGPGFDPAAAELHGSGGFGLYNIRERLRHIRGELTIESSPGQGTRCTITVPCD